MDINEIYSTLDSLSFTEIENYLATQITNASDENRFDIVIPLLNEMIGFLRDTTQFDKGREYATKLRKTLDDCGQQETMNYATSLLNIANFNRAAGDYKASYDDYMQCESIYEQLLPKGDYLWAGLYNNESLLFQMMGDNLAAIGALTKALQIVEALPDRRIEVATTYTNIAQSLAALGQMEEAEVNVKEALLIFAETDNTDYHYSAAAAVMGVIAYNRGDYEEAASYYDKAAKVVERCMGQNDNYNLLIANRDAMLSMIPKKDDKPENIEDAEKTDIIVNGEVKGLDICKRFYEEYGRPMIREVFYEDVNRIAVGLFGEGSDCFGYDDEQSRDHDWGPGFAVFVTRATAGIIGERLAYEYSKLPEEFAGFARIATDEGRGRVGVKIIEDYFKEKLGNAFDEENCEVITENLGLVEEAVLAELTNGEVWKDEEGIVSRIREELSGYYDGLTWKRKLSVYLIKMGQSGQYNLARTLKRGDRATAIITLADYIKFTMHTLFLLNRRYAPYDKWLMRAAGELAIHPEIADCIRAIADMDIKDENVLLTIEIISQIILNALKEQGLVSETEDNWYTEKLGRLIYSEVSKSKEELVDEIVQLEWEAFDKVKNEGGRASCQDDWTTFEIMRKSQYLEWKYEMLVSFINDFKEANARGWNLIAEKYGRMEKSTAPDRYAALEKEMPKHTERQDALIEHICAIQVEMMEEIASKYPKMAGNARTIRTSSDTIWNTSYETYLRGELGTYSEETLVLYGTFIAELVTKGINLSQRILNNTALLYGYKSLEDAEEKL